MKNHTKSSVNLHCKILNFIIMKTRYSTIRKSINWLFIFAILLVSTSLKASGTSGAVTPSMYIYVNSNSYGTGGTSWSDAYQDLQQALDIANPGDTILVASGTYYPTKDSLGNYPSNPRNQTFYIPKGVAVLGGFDANLQYYPNWDMWNHRDPFGSPSRLIGAIGLPTDTDNVYHVVVLSDSVVFSGLKVSNGYANGASITQRFEYLKIAKKIIAKNFFLGTGTGDVATAFNEHYQNKESILNKEFQHRAHNQFVTFFISFGFLGGIISLFILIYPFYLYKNHYLSSVLGIIVLLSMLNEDTLETQAGTSFYAFFFALLLAGTINNNRKRI